MATHLSEKSPGAKYSQSRTDSLIGAGVRVEGNIMFVGVLRIQGDLVGDVSCDADANGTIVVGASGNVAGTLNAPHIIVSGRVNGPVHSWESIEIQHGAHVAGDAYYKEIDIHAGGVIEGSLIPEMLADGDRVRQESRIQSAESSAVKKYGSQLADAVPVGGGFKERVGATRRLRGAIVVLIAMVATIAAVLVSRDPAPVAPPVEDVVPKVDSPAKETLAVQSSAVALQDGQRAIAGEPAHLVPGPGPGADARSVVQTTSAGIPEMDPDKVVVVQGVNPGKPAGVFLVISKEPSVLFRKKRKDSSAGTRIDIAQGATESIAFSNNEIFRVANGQDIQIFYQGRKVTPKTIESGVWMSFVAQSKTGAGDKK